MCISKQSDIQNCEFHYLTNVKKHAMALSYNGVKVLGLFHEPYKTEQERYNNIAEHFMEKLEQQAILNEEVFIEDYSFGSKGRVFHIAENCGILKHKLWKKGFNINVVPPTVIKKFATGKGNADKEKMYEAFTLKHGQIFATLCGNTKIGSPISDLVDAYFLAGYGWSVT